MSMSTWAWKRTRPQWQPPSRVSRIVRLPTLVPGLCGGLGGGVQRAEQVQEIAGHGIADCLALRPNRAAPHPERSRKHQAMILSRCSASTIFVPRLLARVSLVPRKAPVVAVESVTIGRKEALNVDASPGPSSGSFLLIGGMSGS